MKPYYRDDFVTLYHGDARDVLPLLARVDGVVADPPYGVRLIAKQHKWFRSEGKGYEASFEDGPEYIAGVVVPIVRVCIERFGRVVITPGTRNCFA